MMEILVISPRFYHSLFSNVIFEADEIEHVIPPVQIVERLCLEYGSTLDGFRHGIHQLYGYPYKTPVVLKPGEYGFFPTGGYDDFRTSYVFTNEIDVIDEKIHKDEKKWSLIRFNNGREEWVYGSMASVRAQRDRFEQLLVKTRNRERKMKTESKREWYLNYIIRET